MTRGRSSSRPARCCKVSSCSTSGVAWRCRPWSSVPWFIDHSGDTGMESARNHKPLMEGGLAILATAVLVYFGNGLDPLWPLMWFATLPILWFSLRSSSWAAAVAAVVAMMLGSLNLWSYFTQTLTLPGVAWVGIYLTAS